MLMRSSFFLYSLEIYWLYYPNRPPAHSVSLGTQDVVLNPVVKWPAALLLII